MTETELDHVYTYHSPKPDSAPKFGAIRAAARNLAQCINAMCPDSRQKSVALTNVEQSVMWANAAIALSQE